MLRSKGSRPHERCRVRRKAGRNRRGKAPIVIKKYANRRLYNTATSSLRDARRSRQDGEGGQRIRRHDAKTGEDITRAVLTQIIVEEEGKGQNLLPISFLRQLIALYGDSMQFWCRAISNRRCRASPRNQEQMRKSLQDAFGGLFPFGT